MGVANLIKQIDQLWVRVASNEDAVFEVSEDTLRGVRLCEISE